MFSYLWCSKNGTPPPSKAVCGMVRMDDVKSGGTATLWSLSYIEIHTQSELIYIYIYTFVHYGHIKNASESFGHVRAMNMMMRDVSGFVHEVFSSLNGISI